MTKSPQRLPVQARAGLLPLMQGKLFRCPVEGQRSSQPKEAHWPALAVDMFLFLGASMVLSSWGGFKSYQDSK